VEKGRLPKVRKGEDEIGWRRIEIVYIPCIPIWTLINHTYISDPALPFPAARGAEVPSLGSERPHESKISHQTPSLYVCHIYVPMAAIHTLRTQCDSPSNFIFDLSLPSSLASPLCLQFIALINFTILRPPIFIPDPLQGRQMCARVPLGSISHVAYINSPGYSHSISGKW